MTRYKKTPSEVIPGKWVTHIDTREGRFKEGDLVLVSGRIHPTQATVLLTIPPEARPYMEVRKRGIDLKLPKFKGYWREHESYLVRDENGQIRWPRVGCLELMRREE